MNGCLPTWTSNAFIIMFFEPRRNKTCVIVVIIKSLNCFGSITTSNLIISFCKAVSYPHDVSRSEDFADYSEKMELLISHLQISHKL